MNNKNIKMSASAQRHVGRKYINTCSICFWISSFCDLEILSAGIDEESKTYVPPPLHESCLWVCTRHSPWAFFFFSHNKQYTGKCTSGRRLTSFVYCGKLGWNLANNSFNSETLHPRAVGVDRQSQPHLCRAYMYVHGSPSGLHNLMISNTKATPMCIMHVGNNLTPCSPHVGFCFW